MLCYFFHFHRSFCFFHFNISLSVYIFDFLSPNQFQLELEQAKTEDCTIEYSTGTFTCLAAVFKMRRNPGMDRASLLLNFQFSGHLLFSTYIPSVLIVIMSWIRSGVDYPNTVKHLKIESLNINFCVFQIFNEKVQFLDSSGGHPSQGDTWSHLSAHPHNSG